MKNHYILYFFIFLVGVSCSENQTVKDDLVGEWIYERESFSSGSTFEDADTRGTMIFNSDETGMWISDDGSNISSFIEWDLQSLDSKISITKILPLTGTDLTINRIYNLEQSDEDNFTFTHESSIYSIIDTTEVLISFENIILVRK